MHGMAHSLEERRLKLLPAFGRALYFLHMRVHFLPQPPEFLFDGSEFRVTLPMSGLHLGEKRGYTRNRPADVLMVFFNDVLGQIRQRRSSPVGFLRVHLLAVLLKPAQNLFGRYPRVHASLV